MGRILLYILTGCVVSMYYFQIIFSFLPSVNTKNIAAAVGLLLMALHIARYGARQLRFDVLGLLMLSGVVSIISLFSVVYNHTSDTVFVSFIVSTLIWLSGAYAVCSMIKWVHNGISFELLGNYLIAVCVFQCIIALLIEYVPEIASFVDTWVIQGQRTIRGMNRLYGIGASLDTAGARFSACIVILAALLVNNAKNRNGMQWYYITSFVILAIIGNMVARTTLVGIVCAVGYWLMTSGVPRLKFRSGSNRIWRKVFFLLLVCTPLIGYFYNMNYEFHELLRFGFEGFFNLVENGEWGVRSNTELGTMVVFPDDLDTWIIGDAYFENQNSNLNYLGAAVGGYYMGTDIGYCRLIFYFGVVGLTAMIIYMAYAARVCARSVSDYRSVFLWILLAGYIVWCKVATDLFLVFAMFICVGRMQTVYELSADESEI